MKIFLLQSFIQIILLTDTIYSLPVLNFTSSVLTNRMIEALSEALINHDRQKPLKQFQKIRQNNFDYRPAYKQDFADQQHQPYPYYQPAYSEQYHQPFVFQGAPIPEQQPIQQQQYPSFFYQQAPEYQYVPTFPMQYPEHHGQPSYAMPIPEPQASFHQVQSPAQQIPSYSNQQQTEQQQQQQQQQQQHTFYPQNAFETQPQQQPQHNFYPQNVLDTQAKPQHQQPSVVEPVAQQPQQPQQPQQSQSHIPPPIEVQPQAQQLHPIVIEQQPQVDHAVGGSGTGFFYPYPYQNMNWYNFQNTWPQVPGGQVDLKSPSVAAVIPASAAGTGECPTGLCPTGASCSQLAGQWQCACGQNGCSGIQNPCGIFGRYYFPYYPDPSRFIQCDQTGVFWIRRCAPGTIFDPKISVCNYPPVVVETDVYISPGKKDTTNHCDALKRMASDQETLSSSSSISDIGLPDEYYEEVDAKRLDIQKRRAPVPPLSPVPIEIFRSPTPVDPVEKLNKELNRKFRPDLVPPTPVPVLQSVPIVYRPAQRRSPSPDPVIFDARDAKSIKPTKKTNDDTDNDHEQDKKRSTSIKQSLFQRIHNLTALTPVPSASHRTDKLDPQASTTRAFVPPGMMLVPDPSYQPAQKYQTITTATQHSPPYQMASYYQPPAVTQSTSFKNNKVAPPPGPVPIPMQTYPYQPQAVNNSFQTPSSMISNNPLLQTSYAAKPQDQAKMSKKKLSTAGRVHGNHDDRSFALYNQKNGRIEGVVKNRLNLVANKNGDSKLTDEDPQAKSKLAIWCSEPLCMGLTRLSGGILFGSMTFLGVTALAGLIASIVTYTQDSTTDAQWKILGMVVCAIMLITIIITLLVFICCYKNGYMFNQDEDDDLADGSPTRDAEGNERQKAVLRKIYKFNRPNDTPSGMVNNMTPAPIQQTTVLVTDKQTNTESTIAPVRPRDFERGVWTYNNAFGGRIFRPLIAPTTVSRIIQVVPHEIEAALQPTRIVYEFVQNSDVVSPVPEQPRMIKIPAPQVPVIEVLEKPRKPTKTTIVRETVPEPVTVPARKRIEYVEVEEPRARRVVQKPKYEIVEEVADRSESSMMEEFVEIVDIPQHERRHGKKKGKKGFGTISVKHVKTVSD